MKDFAEQANIVIAIATPYSTGAGFYLVDQQLIVTSEQVVHNNREVVVEGATLPRQMTRVIYTDSKYDLAFLSAPPAEHIPVMDLNVQLLAPGDIVTSLGYQSGMKPTLARGAITAATPDENDLLFLQHDAALSAANTGGPLLDEEGHIVGVNTFLNRDGVNIAFALPASYLAETIEIFKKAGGQIGARCMSCETIIFQNTLDQKRYCPHCGAKALLPNQVEEYEPVGVAYTIEAMLTQAGHDERLSRRGPNNWEIHQGSAHISISYYEKTGLITGDAYLCQLPKDQIKPLYEFLLRQNYEIENLNFSVKGQDIVLSLLIYDRYLNVDTGLKLFKHLFAMADYYDNILVEQFGAQWGAQE